MERYYTVNEVCDILHRNSRTIYAYIRSGQLKATNRKPGTTSKYLIAESDLKEFIAAGVRPGYYQELYPRPHKRDKIAQNE